MPRQASLVRPSPASGISSLKRLHVVDNFRDVAGLGDGYLVAGGCMRTRVLYRSNRLEPSSDDLDYLSSLGLTAIHDLRQPFEIERHPDATLPGARWHHHAVPGIPYDVVQALRAPEETYAAMVENYRTFVSDPDCRAGFSSLLNAVAETEGPQLFHCAAGKDRTGWAAALVHHIAGVAWEQAVADYMLTDAYAVRSRQATLDTILETLGEEVVPAFEPAFRCDVNYLYAARDEADRLFGGLDGYIRDGLRIAEATVVELRSRLVLPD
jgi:protein-tyrosine phosphatase